MNTKFLRVAAIAALAFGVLSGCGAADKVSTPASAAEVVRQAGQRAANDSYAMEMTITIDVDGFGEMEMTSEGEFDGQRGRMTADVLGFEMDIIVDGSTAYVSMDGGKQWTREEVDVSQPTGNYDASQMLGYLRSVSDDVVAEGREKVRGRETTRYRVFVAFEDLMADMDEEQRQSFDDLRQFVDIDGFDITAWIDDEGRPAKMEYTFDMDTNGLEANTKFVLEMFDWGRDVDIELPPADSVVEGPAGAGSLFQ